MRILKLDRKEGLARLALQALEDLWHLHKILEPGDLVSAKTYRKVAIKRGSEIVEGEKKPVNLTIRLEKADFHQYTGKLRLSGLITSGPEDIQIASHHTITLEPGMLVTIQKPALKNHQISRLERAKVPEANIYFVAIDRDQADFALMGGMGLEMLGTIHVKKTDADDSRLSFYKQIQEKLESLEGYGKIVLCGPGFERTNLQAFLRKASPRLSGKVAVEHANAIGRPGIQEVIRASSAKILKETRLARETAFVEKLLLGLKKKTLAVYGKDQVEKAIQYGALETLLVSDTAVRDAESLIDSAESISARIAIISSEHQAGEQLLSLGGIAGFLRFVIRE